MAKRKGTYFENKTYEVLKGLNPLSDVQKNVRILGKLSERKREVDVKLVEPGAYDFLAFECKDYKDPIDIPIIEAWNTKLQDIGAKKGAIVSNSSYSDASKSMAAKLNIDLLNLVDTGDDKIHTKIFIPAIITDVMVKSFQLTLSSTSTTPIVFSQDVKTLELQDENGNGGTAFQIFAWLWNLEDTPLSRTPGHYIYKPRMEQKKFIKGLNGLTAPLDEIGFIYEVVERNFTGPVEIIETKGIYNVQEKTLSTKHLITQNIVLQETESIWKELTAEEKANYSDKCTLGMSLISMFSEEDENHISE